MYINAQIGGPLSGVNRKTFDGSLSFGEAQELGAVCQRRPVDLFAVFIPHPNREHTNVRWILLL